MRECRSRRGPLWTRVQRMECVALALAILGAALGAAVPASAKSLCGSVTLSEPFFYVLEKVKTKPGAHGVVGGYLVNAAATQSFPFAGTYVVYGTQEAEVSVSAGVAQTGYGFVTFLHNFGAPLTEGGTSNDYVTAIDGFNQTITNQTGPTSWVDCQTVPKLPVFGP